MGGSPIHRLNSKLMNQIWIYLADEKNLICYMCQMLILTKLRLNIVHVKDLWIIELAVCSILLKCINKKVQDNPNPLEKHLNFAV